ncbi:hypothetical protein BDP81DRAFT_389221 [Colletotrichum phormii]|uniref:Uncharacterized protein n=1 Tax=Colletotrichum phormii TaxID=359342 RepID=A0AAJ0EMC4_9PEZI|nr:uncharacterized protein BDP81DRAFT_389221 [Colletotrichum phormii]KAK1656447.1 hypothetical protein BDP81DRAFT_389221 [Colletotrichum phormii]
MAYKFHKLPGRQEWLVSVTDPKEAQYSYQMFGHGEPFQYLGRSRPCSVPRIDNPAQTWLQSNNALEYSIQERRNDTTINLVCPYICYAGLQELKVSALGLKYVDFMQQLRLSRRRPEQAEAILGFKKALCRYPDLAVTKPPVITVNPAPKHISAELVSNETQGSQNHHESAGFFNHIPGLSIVAQHEDIWQDLNLVSSTWSDWETFPINKDLPENAYPKLQSQAGDLINCRGAIRGNWTLSSLTESYLVEAVFVVDAVFTSIEKPGVQFDFVFSTDTVTSYGTQQWAYEVW